MTLQDSPSKCRIKLCGFKDVQHIKALSGLPITEVGFVFAKSKRQVTAEQAKELLAELSKLQVGHDVSGNLPRAVGVFVNASLQELSDIMAKSPLDVIQLHGNEDPVYCQQLKKSYPSVHVWKVFSIREPLQADEALHAVKAYQGVIEGILLDAPGGGTGEIFQWSAIEAFQIAAAECEMMMYVAGGLHVDNVQLLLQRYKVDGVDVSSGIENNGVKDINLIESFVRRVIET